MGLGWFGFGRCDYAVCDTEGTTQANVDVVTVVSVGISVLWWLRKSHRAGCTLGPFPVALMAHDREPECGFLWVNHQRSTLTALEARSELGV